MTNLMDLTDKEFEISEGAYRRGYRQAVDDIVNGQYNGVSAKQITTWQIKVWKWAKGSASLLTKPPGLPYPRP